MTLNESLLAGIEDIENVFIPMPDGCRLAARLWLPADARTNPVPAVLEYIPYRKRDFMRSRDEPIHRYFAAHGYAAIRVDVRGSGDSDGLLRDEYSAEELDDALAIINWLTQQPWCDGNVGMMGISWGGFNALQVAALRPAALKAIITLCSTDDRYADDAHYMGGCLLNENLQWGSILMLYGALPPDPLIVGDRWRDMWRERIDGLEAFPARWMGHPRRDAFWQHGSVCEDYAAIECAVYAIGGWADAYTNAVPRLMEHLSCPKKALIGPWAHAFPHDATPGPSIGFLQEAVRWWDRWLRGIDNGIMDEPACRFWMQESVPPRPQYAQRPGRWIAEASWPTPNVHAQRLHLNPGHLGPHAEAPTEISFSSPQTVGVRGGEWCGFGADGEAPPDQRSDDGGSVTFDSDPLPGRLELLGAPVLELDFAVDVPVALVCARLSDIAPDGSALRVSYGLLNLSHLNGHAVPEALEPGRWYRLRLALNHAGHAFPAGHRVRLALSTAYWPIAWPSPDPARLTLRTGTSTFDLPVRTPSAQDAALTPFSEAEAAPAAQFRKLRHLPLRRRIEIDLATNEMVYDLHGDGGELGGAALAHIADIDLDLGYTLSKRFRILEDDPTSAQAELRQTTLMNRGPWRIRVQCNTRLTATRTMFQFACDLEAWEGDTQFRQRSWTLAIPREFV